MGVVLPSNWGGLGPTEKISFFNNAGVDADRLEQSGVSRSDIEWMRNNGYNG